MRCSSRFVPVVPLLLATLLLVPACGEHAAAEADVAGLRSNPVFGDPPETPVEGGTLVTPTGFVATLKESSTRDAHEAVGTLTWSSVQLARHGDQALEFVAPAEGKVNPPLMQGLLSHNLFLVANDWDALGDMKSELIVDGFAFHVQPPEGPDASKTIAVFKFTPGASLDALIDRPDDWFRPDPFVSGGDIAAIQADIRQAIHTAKAAKGTPTDPFEHFRDTIATDPQWTGVVFVHVPINGNDMPATHNVLLAGIDGEWYAHHFGFHATPLQTGEAGRLALSQSSLFGVIHHQGTPPKPPVGEEVPFDVTVLDLTVEIQNSAVSLFDALVAMSLPRLLDRTVAFEDPMLAALTKAPSAPYDHRAADFDGLVNTLVLRGTYQKQGDVPTLTFQRRNLAGIPVFREQRVNTATLAPSAMPSDQPRRVDARFELGGRSLDESDWTVGLDISFTMTQAGGNSGDTSIDTDDFHVRVPSD